MDKATLKGLMIMIILIMSTSLMAQHDRHPAINLSGQILDEHGNVLGWISKEGIVQNAIDDRIAVIDKEGNATNAEGRKIGKMDKNGTFHNDQGVPLFTVAAQKGQSCELIDPQGRIIGIVHPHFKNQASAIHCLYAKMKIN